MRCYEIHPDFNVALFQFGGSVRGKGLIETVEACHADPRWHHGMDVIWDCRGVRSLDLPPSELLTLANLRTEDVAGRDASIVARIVDEGIARLYSMMAARRGKEAFVCHTVEEALEALGLGEDAREALGL